MATGLHFSGGTTLAHAFGAFLLFSHVAYGAPGNDAFADAAVLNPAATQVTGSNVGATAEAGEPLSTWVGGGKSVWWRYDATADGFLEVKTAGSLSSAGEELDTVLGVFAGTEVADLTWITYNDDDDNSPGWTSAVFFPVQKGKRYYIAVDSFDNGDEPADEGSIRLSYILSDPIKAPNWILPNIDGTMYNSSNLLGKVTLVNVWATWCGPCRDEIPDLIELQSEYERFGFSVIGISIDDAVTPGVAPTDLVGGFSANFGINYPVVMTRPRWSSVEDEYGDISAIPTTFIVDRNNNMMWMLTGSRTKEEFAEIVKPYLFDNIEVTVRQEGGETVLEWPSTAGAATVQVEKAGSCEWKLGTSSGTDGRGRSARLGEIKRGRERILPAQDYGAVREN